MGNRLCKRRADNNKPPTSLDKIIRKLTLKPKWKSDPNLEDKQVNSYQVNKKTANVPQRPPRPLSTSKSSDWTDIPLGDDDPQTQTHVKNKNSSLIFNDDHTPVPPPRKHKKGIREKLEAVFQYKKPIEEQIIQKKVIIYRCSCCDNGVHIKKSEKQQNKENGSIKEVKNRKTPSVASLPNYSEFKLSVADESSVDLSDKHSSAHSLPDETKKLTTKNSTEKLESYLTRARSFGSLLPTMLLHKMSTTKAPLAEIESDDSMGGLDDWGLNIIEHYKPKDSSLPRPRKPTTRTEEEMLADIQSQFVAESEEDLVITKKEAQKQNNENNNVLQKIYETNEVDKLPQVPPRRPSTSDHSSLMKILEKYGNNSISPSAQQPVSDFLKAEREYVMAERGLTMKSIST